MNIDNQIKPLDFITLTAPIYSNVTLHTSQGISRHEFILDIDDSLMSFTSNYFLEDKYMFFVAPFQLPYFLDFNSLQLPSIEAIHHAIIEIDSSSLENNYFHEGHFDYNEIEPSNFHHCAIFAFLFLDNKLDELSYSKQALFYPDKFKLNLIKTQYENNELDFVEASEIIQHEVFNYNQLMLN